MKKPNFISEIQKKIHFLTSWYSHGSKLAQIVIDLDDLTDEFEEWVENSSAKWEKAERMPIQNLYDQLADFHKYLDVQVEKQASDIENRVKKIEKKTRNQETPPYINELIQDIEDTLETFEHERTLVRNAVIKAENSLDAEESPMYVANNLAEIEENEMENMGEIEDSITRMRRKCVDNNLVRALKISRILPK